ncbi:hypothetical protein G9P44_000455 [Scheffersomyces stipitis]|nr:hypothetical protein G9P44_000455 [Scheffersomyces stipitis]
MTPITNAVDFEGVKSNLLFQTGEVSTANIAKPRSNKTKDHISSLFGTNFEFSLVRPRKSGIS